MRTYILLAIVAWTAPTLALDTNYCPFSAQEMLRISSTRTTTETGTSVAAIFARTSDGTTEFRIAVGRTNVVAVPVTPWLEHTKTIIADLDGNGLEDVIKEAYPGTQGLMLGCHLMVFSQYLPGKFALIAIPSERFSSDDICDLDGDGSKEIVTCVLVGFENHNYWVYRCWQLSGRKLISVDNQHGFPRAVWFTNKPNRRRLANDLLMKIMVNYPELTLEGEDQSDSLRDIESPMSVTNGAMERTVSLRLKSRCELREGTNQVLFTVHAEDPAGYVMGLHQLAVWRATSNEYRKLDVFECYDDADIKAFNVKGKSFVFATLSDPSAGAAWVRTAIYYFDSTGALRMVPLVNRTWCPLPQLSLDEGGASRGCVYQLKHDKITFAAPIWLDGDPPNFPSGGGFEGELILQEQPDGTYVAEVDWVVAIPPRSPMTNGAFSARGQLSTSRK